MGGRNRGPTAHAGVIVDLEVLRDRATTIRRPCDERPRLLLPLSTVDPRKMQHAVRSHLHGIKSVLDHLIIVVHQYRGPEGTPAVVRPAQPQLTRKRLVGSHLGMGHRPRHKHVLSLDDEGWGLLAIVGALAGL